MTNLDMEFEFEYKDILKAVKRIKPLIRETPLEYSRYYSEKIGANVFLKLENLQLTGSYKIRGALNSMLSLSEEQRKKGVIAASSGNHAQGIGFASQLMNIPATIVVPKVTPVTKIEAIKSYGVHLRIEGEFYDDSERLAREIEKQENKTYISPYNDPVVMAGQGTVGIEMMNQNPELDVLLVPAGGGGILSGVAFAVKKINPKIEVYGIQSEASKPMYVSFRKGKIVDVPMQDTIAEGLYGSIEKGSITFPVIMKYCKDILLVSEAEIREEIITFLKHHHQECEGASAVGLAALLRYSEMWTGKNVGVVITGGNLDYADLLKIIKEKTN